MTEQLSDTTAPGNGNGHPEPSGGLPEGAMRNVLTVAQIMTCPPDCKEEWLEIPEWGGWVKLRSPTALASAEIKGASISVDTEGETVGMDIPAMERAQVRTCVVEPAMTEDEVTAMQAKFGPSFRRIIEALDSLGGPLGKDKKDGEEALRRKAENTFR